MLGKVLGELDPSSTVTVNVHTGNKERAKKVFEVLSDAGYSHTEREGYINFSLPGETGIQGSTITVF